MLRSVAETMAREQVYVLPVLEPGSQKVVGIVRVEDLLAARVRAHDRENKQLRVRRLRNPFARSQATAALADDPPIKPAARVRHATNLDAGLPPKNAAS